MLIISHEELRTLWERTQVELTTVAPKERYLAMHAVAERLFSGDRQPDEIANRFYALMVCLDASQEDLDRAAFGIYGESGFGIDGPVMRKLWDYFGDVSRHVDPRNVVRACEIV